MRGAGRCREFPETFYAACLHKGPWPWQVSLVHGGYECAQRSQRWNWYRQRQRMLDQGGGVLPAVALLQLLGSPKLRLWLIPS